MERLKSYSILLLISSPFLLMIFAPNIIEPVFHYFAGWNRKILFAIVLNISFICFYFQFRGLLPLDSLIYLKTYYLLSSLISIITFFTPYTFLIYKTLFYVGYLGMFLFVILFNYIKDAKGKKK